MKCLQLILILSILLHFGNPDGPNFFKFRQTTLDNFNNARRFIAGGDIGKLVDLIKTLIPLFKKVNTDFLGPAANMYQLKWSRQLEQVAFEYLKESKKSSNPMASIEYKDHIGFYWLGNVFNILSDVVGFAVPEGKLKEKFKDFLEVVEAIVMFIWLALAAPKSIPIKEGAMFGPAEAMFGERYEIGCFTEILYSVCFLKRLPYRESMFKSGIPCTSCPTHCEYWQESDGTITEGELCVPPKEEQVNFVASNMTLTDTVATDSITFALMIPFILILAFHSWK